MVDLSATAVQRRVKRLRDVGGDRGRHPS
ncbi:hypothetical protein NKI31_24115 [Mesorhizobium sp. M0659]